MDMQTEKILMRYHPNNIKLISLDFFEKDNPDVFLVKSSRTLGEYCWTITPALVLHCINKYKVAQICYIDADLCFYQDPSCLLKESENQSILLSPHRYTKKYDQSKTSGIYCVQFMNFKNTPEGLEALTWWRNACIEWCYNRIEPNRFGDQKYLDDWPQKFKSVHVLEHLGGGVAPWNVQQYDFMPSNDDNLKMQSKDNVVFDLVFYHFHGVKIYSNKQIEMGSGYYLSDEIKRKLYFSYIKKVLNIDNMLLKNGDIDNKTYLEKICDKEDISIKKFLQRIRNKLINNDNKMSCRKLLEVS